MCSRYRKYEIAMNWDEGQFLASQVIIAHKDARFLKLFLETYRNHYDPNKWYKTLKLNLRKQNYLKTFRYYNAGERPTTEVLNHHPELVSRE